MEPIVLPIVGVAPNHPGWQEILNNFQSHMNPTVTKKHLQKLFRNPAHCGYLASLLLMKQILLSPDSYWRTLVDVTRTIISLMTSLAKLLELGGDPSPRAIFHESKTKFMDELLNGCGCAECCATTGVLEAFVEGRRLPRLSPHVKECEIERLLFSLHMNGALFNKLSINEEHLAALLVDPQNYIDFENKTKMAILASIMHLGSLYFLVNELERRLFAEVEQEIVNIVSLEDSTPFPCSSKRALEMILSQSDGNCHRVNLPYLPTKHHLPPSDGAKLSKSLLQKLNHVLRMGSPLSLSSALPSVDPSKVPTMEEPILVKEEAPMPCCSSLPESVKRHHNLRRGETYLLERREQHPPEDDPIINLNQQLLDLTFDPGEDLDDGHQGELSSLYSGSEEKDFGPLDLLNGDDWYEELSKTYIEDLESWMINSAAPPEPEVKRPTQDAGGSKRRTKKKKVKFSNPYFRV